MVLSWSLPSRTTDRQSVRYLGKTEICRSLGAALKKCEPVVGSVPPPANFERQKKTETKKVSETFTDTLSANIERESPMSSAVYAVEVQNAAGRAAGISDQVKVPLVPTLPPFPQFGAQAQAAGVLVTWQCPHDTEKIKDLQYLFRIYRRSDSSKQFAKIAEVPATDCAETMVQKDGDGVRSFLDQTFEWEETYFYRGTVVSAIEIPGKPAVEVEGDDTPEVKVFAHDIFPPAIPSGLQAVFSGFGQAPFVDLIWNPVTDPDVEGYNIYRHETGGEPEKLNSEPVQAPAFRDTRVLPGKTYFYSVSAVDQRGNESARSSEASEKVP